MENSAPSTVTICPATPSVSMVPLFGPPIRHLCGSCRPPWLRLRPTPGQSPDRSLGCPGDQARAPSQRGTTGRIWRVARRVTHGVALSCRKGWISAMLPPLRHYVDVGDPGESCCTYPGAPTGRRTISHPLLKHVHPTQLTSTTGGHHGNARR